jgi:hypothetical protein
LDQNHERLFEKKSGVRMAKKKWSKRVNETSDAMDLKEGVFKSNSAKKIASSVSQSAAKSNRKKSSPFRSAMSMLNFYINRGGKNLSKSKTSVLERAKNELRKIYHKPLKPSHEK